MLICHSVIRNCSDNSLIVVDLVISTKDDRVVFCQLSNVMLTRKVNVTVHIIKCDP